MDGRSCLCFISLCITDVFQCQTRSSLQILKEIHFCQIKCSHTLDFLVQNDTAYADAFTLLCLLARSRRNRTETIHCFYESNEQCAEKIKFRSHSTHPLSTLRYPWRTKLGFCTLTVLISNYYTEAFAVSSLPPECSQCCLSVCLSWLNSADLVIHEAAAHRVIDHFQMEIEFFWGGVKDPMVKEMLKRYLSWPWTHFIKQSFSWLIPTSPT